MVKVVWTFENGVEGAVLISSALCILKMSVLTLRIYIEL